MEMPEHVAAGDDPRASDPDALPGTVQGEEQRGPQPLTQGATAPKLAKAESIYSARRSSDPQSPGAFAVSVGSATEAVQEEKAELGAADELRCQGPDNMLVSPIADQDLHGEVHERIFGETVEAISATVVHDTGQGIPEATRWSRKKQMIVLVAIIVVATAVVAVVTVTTTNSLNERPSPAPATNELTESDDELLERLRSFQESLGMTDYDSLSDFSSPQYKSFRSLRGLLLDVVALRFYYALRTLYFSTSGDTWDHSNAWLSHYSPNAETRGHCEWYSSRPETSCTRGTEMSVLALECNNLEGTLPPELALLSSHLTEIYLSKNSLQSTIPEVYYQLTKLRVIDLSENPHLSGTFFADDRINELSRLTTVEINGTNLDAYAST